MKRHQNPSHSSPQPAKEQQPISSAELGGRRRGRPQPPPPAPHARLVHPVLSVLGSTEDSESRDADSAPWPSQAHMGSAKDSSSSGGSIICALQSERLLREGSGVASWAQARHPICLPALQGCAAGWPLPPGVTPGHRQGCCLQNRAGLDAAMGDEQLQGPLRASEPAHKAASGTGRPSQALARQTGQRTKQRGLRSCASWTIGSTRCRPLALSQQLGQERTDTPCKTDSAKEPGSISEGLGQHALCLRGWGARHSYLGALS